MKDMRSDWQSTRLGWTVIATMFATALVEWSLVPGEHSHPVERRGLFGDLVLWLNGVVLNMNYLLLPALLLMCAALGNLLLRAAQKGRGSALPG